MGGLQASQAAVHAYDWLRTKSVAHGQATHWEAVGWCYWVLGGK